MFPSEPLPAATAFRGGVMRPLIDPEEYKEYYEEHIKKSDYLKYFIYIILVMIGMGVAGFFITSFIYGTFIN